MRTALISDIHGNYDGLMAVIHDINSEKCDRIICLGDLVDGGEYASEVIAYIESRSILTIQGNHDDCPNTELPMKDLAFLSTLPKDLLEDNVIYTHTSPRAAKRKITTAIEAWNVFDETTFRRIFVGDVHIPLVFGEKCVGNVSATEYEIPYDAPFQFEHDDRYIICVGAVGYSRDGYHWLRYAIYDDILDTIIFRAPEGPITRF